MSHMALYVHLHTFTVFLQYVHCKYGGMGGGRRKNRGEEWGRRREEMRKKEIEREDKGKERERGRGRKKVISCTPPFSFHHYHLSLGLLY